MKHEMLVVYARIILFTCRHAVHGQYGKTKAEQATTAAILCSIFNKVFESGLLPQTASEEECKFAVDIAIGLETRE